MILKKTDKFCGLLFAGQRVAHENDTGMERHKGWLFTSCSLLGGAWNNAAFLSGVTSSAGSPDQPVLHAAAAGRTGFEGPGLDRLLVRAIAGAHTAGVVPAVDSGLDPGVHTADASVNLFTAV